MGKFDRNEFSEFILQNKVVGFPKEPIKLKSGRVSPYYVNWRNVAEDVCKTDMLANYVVAYVEDLGLEPKTFFGVPEGATKIGIITQYKWALSRPNFGPDSHILAMGRGKPKEHGDPKDRDFLGVPVDAIILEDVTTTGESLVNSIKSLYAANVNLLAAIGLTNRNEKRDDGDSVECALKKEGVTYYEMSNAVQLVSEAYKKLRPGVKTGKLVEAYFKKYGTHHLKIVR